MSKAGPMDLTTVMKILHYLKGTLALYLCLGGNDIALKGYCNANWSGDASQQRSTMECIFCFGDGAISWNSRRQPIIALSTLEAGYMAISH